MTDYFINVLMSWSGWFIVLTVVYIAECYFKVISNRKSSFRLYIIGLVATLLLCMTSSDITYKHTTNYNKEVDVHKVQQYNSDKREMTSSPIKDKTLKPKLDEQSREDRFKELTTY